MLFQSLAKAAIRPILARAYEWRARLSARPRAVVLVYHETSAGPARRDAVVPVLQAAALERHLRVLRRRYRVVPARDVLVAAARRRRGQRLPVAVTFDDDLRSHLEVAAPVLLRHGVTATFYLTGVGLEGGTFWWQSLQAAIDRGADLAPVATEFGLPAHPPSALTAGIEALSPPRRSLLAARLEALAGPDPDRRTLDAGEIRRLAGLGFAIGFHTREHNRLTGLSDDELAAALRDGREALEAAAGVALVTIAYPHGDADERVGRAAAAADFELGFVTAMTAVTPTDDRHLLARPEILAPTTARFALDLARLYASERRARTASSSS